MPTYEKLTDLPAEVRADLADWLLCLADNKRVLGLRYGEWCTGSPELEADVAVSAMAQYELGHARLLRGVLADIPEDPRTRARGTDPAAWRSLPCLDRPAPSWSQVIVLNGLVDGLLTTNLEAATEGGLMPLAQRLRKAVSEEQFHTLHARAWAERLRGGPPEIVDTVRGANREVLRQCLTWLGPVGGGGAIDRLASAGVLPVDAAGLRDRYLDAVEPVLGDVGEYDLARTATGWEVAELDFSGWDEHTRRQGVPDFDEPSFAMMTGAHARAMGVRD